MQNLDQNEMMIDSNQLLQIQEKLKQLPQIMDKLIEIEKLPDKFEFQFKTCVNEYKSKIHHINEKCEIHESRFTVNDEKRKDLIERLRKVEEGLKGNEKAREYLEAKILKNDAIVMKEIHQQEIHFQTIEDRLRKCEGTFNLVRYHETSKAN